MEKETKEKTKLLNKNNLKNMLIASIIAVVMCVFGIIANISKNVGFQGNTNNISMSEEASQTSKGITENELDKDKQIESLIKEKEVLQNQLTESSEKIKELETQVTELSEKSNTLQQKITSLEQEKSELENKMQIVQEQYKSEKSNYTSSSTSKNTNSNINTQNSYSNTTEEVVYITNTGKKYHRSGCSYLKSSKKINKSEAINRGYTPCSRCNP